MAVSLNRRQLSIGLALAGVLGPSLAARALDLPARKFDNVTLRVATFPGTWIDRVQSELGAPLQAAGIKLEFVPGTSAEFLAKLVAAKGQPAPFDVVEIADETYPEYRAGNFLAPLDLAQIPNVSKLAASLYDTYRVANWISEPAVVYNADKFAAAGIARPQRFSDLIDERLKGRVLVADISVYIAYYQITALAYENGGSERDPEAGFAALKRIQPHSATSAIATVSQLFQSGDIWAAIWPTNVAARLSAAGLNISVVHPTIKGKRPALARGYVGLVNGSPRKEAAQYYINALLTAPFQHRIYSEAGLIPVTNDVLTEISGQPVLDHGGHIIHLVKPSDIAGGWWPDYSVINKRDWARRQQRALSS